MLKIKRLLASSLISVFFLTGCTQDFKNQDMGAVFGGVAGGILGNQVGGGSGKTIATIVGATAGALVGGSIGQRMDKIDAMNVNSALENQKDNRGSTWVNPNTNARYTVTPTATTHDGSTACRDYKMQAIINGNSEFVNGRACRINGRWVQQ
ncbi:MAG: glycine zipper 2TM domain-containing protein [Gammaproteobacteria bacterium]|nr:glycine zipper 2TM domain-containing protein [Gammaproteobacteria bacterium]